MGPQRSPQSSFRKTFAVLDEQTAEFLRQHKSLAAVIGVGIIISAVAIQALNGHSAEPTPKPTPTATSVAAPVQANALNVLNITVDGNHIENGPLKSATNGVAGAQAESTAAPTMAPTQGPALTAKPPGPVLSITTPTSDADNKFRTSSAPMIIGTIANQPPDTDIWLVINREGDDAYYRQGPATITADGSFRLSATLGMDQPGDIGQTFDVTLALVPKIVSNSWFSEYQRRLRQGRHFLPAVQLPDLTNSKVLLVSTSEFVVTSIHGPQRTSATTMPLPNPALGTR